MRIAVLLLLAACGTDIETQPRSAPSDVYYRWDGRDVLCSVPIDDLTGVTRNWPAEESRIRAAHDHAWVTFAHAHIPGETVSRDALEQLFTLADQYHLDYVTFAELPTDTPRPALAFAFDDWSVDAWLSVRDILNAHKVHATFFVGKWATLTADELKGVATLAADGHDIEPHSVNHVHALDYVAQNGIDAYVQDEVVPSIEIEKAAGYHPTAYAYPFGEHDEDIDAAVLQVIPRVRTTPGECPP